MLYELIRRLSFLSSVLWVYTIYLVLQGMGHTTVYTVANSVYHSVANSVLDQLQGMTFLLPGSCGQSDFSPGLGKTQKACPPGSGKIANLLVRKMCHLGNFK